MWRSRAISDTAPVPWKNGGGITRELIASHTLQGDTHASLPWRWRVSVADVSADGPFSHFGGTQRLFAVLTGSGVGLEFSSASSSSSEQKTGTETDHKGGCITLTAASAPICFSGEEACMCRLIDGPTTDFNLMCRDGLVGRLERFQDGVRMEHIDVGGHGHEAAPVTDPNPTGSSASALDMQPRSLPLKITGPLIAGLFAIKEASVAEACHDGAPLQVSAGVLVWRTLGEGEALDVTLTGESMLWFEVVSDGKL